MVAVAVAWLGRCSAECNVLSLHFLISLSLFLSLPISSRLSLRQLWWLHATFSFGLFAVRSVVPFSIRIHRALLHHVMCLLHTSMFSLKWLFSPSPFSPTYSSSALLLSSLSWASCTLLSLSRSSLSFSSHFLLSSSRSHSPRVVLSFWRSPILSSSSFRRFSCAPRSPSLPSERPFLSSSYHSS